MRVLSAFMVKRPSKTKVRELLDAAAAKFDSNDTRLAEACGCTQNAIWQARARGSVSAELARAIHSACAGSPSAADFRPDLWPLVPEVHREAIPA